MIEIRFVEKFGLDSIISLKNVDHYRILTLLGIELWVRKPRWLWELKKKLQKIKSRLVSSFSIKNKQDRKKDIGDIYRKKIEAQEKEIILNSFLWDPLWYCRKYGYNFSKPEALDYWYKKGWQKGESPSKYLNLDYCKYVFTYDNPIIAYMSKNLVFFPDNKNNFKSYKDIEKIEQYLEYKKTRKAKSVVYTCITNNYDSLDEIRTYHYVNKDWDYVCFTDNKKDIEKGQVGIWKVLPIQFNELDDSRNNRWHKMHPHLLFPEYEDSIYLDSNINILTDKLFREIETKNQDFILPEHFSRMCIYEEYKRVLSRKLDNRKIIKQEFEVIKKSGMPHNFGLTENNILYRKHHNPEIIAMMDEWWDMLIKYSKRDQLALIYILWKHGYDNLKDFTIENARLDWENFYMFDHKKG